jgi:predicted enzyme related to lactoylglutathione lyase
MLVFRQNMQRVTGIGGIFFKAKDPEKLYQWYEKHLGICRESHGDGVSFRWADDRAEPGMTVWAIFPSDTKYFNPSASPFMINFRVADLDAVLSTLKSEGVEIDSKREDYDYGRFAWIMDPEGNRIELWEPK